MSLRPRECRGIELFLNARFGQIQSLCLALRELAARLQVPQRHIQDWERDLRALSDGECRELGSALLLELAAIKFLQQ
jgi:hypothetical protein